PVPGVPPTPPARRPAGAAGQPFHLQDSGRARLRPLPHCAAQLSRAARDAARRGLRRRLAPPVRLVARAAWPRPDHPCGLPGGAALLAGGELLRGYGRAPGGAAAVLGPPARLVEGMEEKRRLTSLGAVRTWYDDYFRANGTWPTTADYAETILRLL